MKGLRAFARRWLLRSLLLAVVLVSSPSTAMAGAPAPEAPLGWVTLLAKSADMTGWAVASDRHGTVYVGGAAKTNYTAFGRAFLSAYTDAGRLLWSSNFGNIQSEAMAVAADDSSTVTGSVYVTGYTDPAGLSASSGAAQGKFGGGAQDAFVAAYDRNGHHRWTTYLGGSGSEFGFGITVDEQGNCYVTGQTNSANFPVTTGAAQATTTGTDDHAFVASYDPAGQLRWATYLGGSSRDVGIGIAYGGTPGNVYVIGDTTSPDFPVSPGASQSAHGGLQSIPFIASYDMLGHMRWATFLGALDGGDEYGNAIAVDGQGNAYVTGGTPAADFPVTAGAAQSAYHGVNGADSAFVASFDVQGRRRWSTFLGGSGDGSDLQGDVGHGVAIQNEPGGTAHVFVTGFTNSTDFPQSANVLRHQLSMHTTGTFVASFDSAGALRFSTILGDSNSAADAQANGIAVDPSGGASDDVFLTGIGATEAFLTPGAAVATYPTDGFLAHIIVPTAIPAAVYPLQSPPTNPQMRYFPTVHHTIRAPALGFWSRLGGVQTLGLPLSEPFTLSGLRVQVTERALLIFSGNQVALAPLGRILSASHVSKPVRPVANTAQRHYFPSTGHSVTGAFLKFWLGHQGAVLLGAPIAEQGQEINGDGTGQLYVTQWFENGRLEWHPEQADARYRVQLGRVGAEYLRRLGLQ